jgi:CRP-like cAMP-binding protein
VVDHRAFQALLSTRPQIASDMSAILALRSVALHGQRADLSAEAQARAVETKSALLNRIRTFFHLE